ncbi:hypothetical protein CLOP_g17936 [Closterium sp. NIES-67]|nr:hypothetical protein CLOP_g17936 [Closterium sp. NIES-67]
MMAPEDLSQYWDIYAAEIPCLSNHRGKLLWRRFWKLPAPRCGTNPSHGFEDKGYTEQHYTHAVVLKVV